MLYESSGVLRYSIVDIGYKAIVEVEQDLADYYRILIPKYKDVQRQRYGAHISVVRHEVPPNLALWGKYEGEEIPFMYDSEIKSGTRPKDGKIFYWLNVFSARLEEVRTELGLPVSSQYTLPPEGYLKCFHTTIGNCSTVV